MFNEILACLDGSSLAQTILPLAQGITTDAGATLTVLRVVGDADELAAEENALRECSRRYGAEVSLLLSRDPAAAIVGTLETKANAIAAMTTHGRTAWGEAILAVSRSRSCAARAVRSSSTVPIWPKGKRRNESAGWCWRWTAASSPSA